MAAMAARKRVEQAQMALKHIAALSHAQDGAQAIEDEDDEAVEEEEGAGNRRAGRRQRAEVSCSLGGWHMGKSGGGARELMDGKRAGLCWSGLIDSCTRPEQKGHPFSCLISLGLACLSSDCFRPRYCTGRL